MATLTFYIYYLKIIAQRSQNTAEPIYNLYLLNKKAAFLPLDKLIYLFILVLAFIKIMITGPIYFSDSSGYVNMQLVRSFGYPYYIYIHQVIFGKYFANALIITQFLLSSGAALFLVKCIQKSIAFNRWFALSLFLILMFPVFTGIKIANLILSEALAYPLYLLIVANLLVGIVEKINKYFYYSIILTFILLLIRGQFLFLIPVLLISIILANYKSLFDKRSLVLFVCALIVPFLSIYADITFHKIVHKRQVTTPWTGIQISTIPFFVSDQNDSLIFKNKEQRHYFRHIYSKLKEKKLLYSQHPVGPKTVDFFFENYVEICNHTLHRNGLETFQSNAPFEDKIIFNDKITTAMTLPLIQNNFKKWLGVYTSNFIKGFDTSKYFLLTIILLAVSLITLIRKENKLSKIIILLVLLQIGNVAIVALAEPTIGRYTFYNNWILIAVVLMLFQTNLAQKSND